jgi:hypothetical protein
LLVATVALPLVAAGAAPKEPDKTILAAPGGCSESAKVQLASSDKPRPEALCLVNICKVDNGVLYHCVANVCQDCCRYDTNLDCTPDPTCSYNVPPYCTSSTSCPPKACKHTCGQSTCGPAGCH